MKKIVVDYLYKNYFSARSKAREDINIVAQKYGYDTLFLQTYTTTEAFLSKKHSVTQKYLYHFRKLWVLFKGILFIPRHSKVLIQYPLSPFGDFFTSLFCIALKMRKCNITFLVHDIVSLREHGQFIPIEIKTLNKADRLILHTPSMEKVFKEANIIQKTELLYLFDYITNDTLIHPKFSPIYHIAFAGNLEKSTFLNKLCNLPFTNTKFLLYGVFYDNLKTNKWIEYSGKFSPEHVGAICADWGLVWDGDSLDCCNGVLGEYLKINSPHKTSLYLAAGIPVIIWEKSALKNYIEEHNLGITVDSISEIEEKIKNLSIDKWNTIKSNVLIYSNKLRNGEMLSPHL